MLETKFIIKCKKLNYNIGYRKILKNINFEIEPKDKILLLGDNGTGKSTLMKLVANHNLYKKNLQWGNIQKHNKNFKISYLGHELGLYTSLSLKENLNYFLNLLGSQIENERLEYLLEAFRLNKRLGDPIHTFSRGMKQKAALIRALLPNSMLLLLDEPFSGLDSNSSSLLVELLKNFVRCDSMLIVTHNPSILSELVNKHFFLKGGELEIDRNLNT